MILTWMMKSIQPLNAFHKCTHQTIKQAAALSYQMLLLSFISTLRCIRFIVSVHLSILLIPFSLLLILVCVMLNSQVFLSSVRFLCYYSSLLPLSVSLFSGLHLRFDRGYKSDIEKRFCCSHCCCCCCCFAVGVRT